MGGEIRSRITESMKRKARTPNEIVRALAVDIGVKMATCRPSPSYSNICDINANNMNVDQPEVAFKIEDLCTSMRQHLVIMLCIKR